MSWAEEELFSLKLKDQKVDESLASHSIYFNEFILNNLQFVMVPPTGLSEQSIQT